MCVAGPHEADDRVVDHFGGPAGHWAAAVHRDLDLAAAAPADLSEIREPLKESTLVAGRPRVQRPGPPQPGRRRRGSFT